MVNITERGGTQEINAGKNNIAKVDEIKLIDLNEITINKQSRTRFKKETIRELAKNIRANGLINPITLRQDKDKLVVVAGEMRLKAFMVLANEVGQEFTKIPTIIKKIEKKQAIVLNLVENFARSDLTKAEEHAVFEKLRKEGNSQKEIADILGLTFEACKKRIQRTKINDAVADGSDKKPKKTNTNKLITNYIVANKARLTIKDLPVTKIDAINQFIKQKFEEFEKSEQQIL